MVRVALLVLGLLALACGGAATPPTRTLPAAVATAAPTRAPTLAPVACPTVQEQGPATTATIELQKGGTIVLQLRPDKAPKTVANFVKKARDCFYDGLTFHRVVANFVAQGGDPLGTGTGGGKQDTELSDLPFRKGALGVARGGDIKVSNDAQFFIVTGDAPHLNGQYTNFGQVTSGQDVADKIKVGDKIKSIRVGPST